MEADIKALRDEITEHFARGRIDQGNRLLVESETVLPEHVKLECMGTRYFYQRNFQDAVECYETAIGLEPDYLISRYQYLAGVQEERAKNFVAAFDRYQAAIEAEPTFVDPYVELGGMLTKVEDFQGAAQCYRDAVRLDPLDVANHMNLKAVLGKLAQLEPERYDEELAAVKTACEAIAKTTAKDLSKHQW